MSAQYVAALVPQIKGILSSADLSSISAKGVRKQLIASGHEESVIKENRGAIDEKIAEIYETLTANRDPGSPPSPPGPSTSANPPSSLPEPLRKPKIKTEVKSEVKTEAYVPPRRVEETDEEMAARLQREFDAEGSTGRASRSAGAPKKKVKKARKRKADDDGDGTPKKRRGGGGGAFNKELLLSDALAAFVGEPRLSRPQVVKRIWEYVKEHNLQDPADKRYILCDDALRSIFGTDKVHMFTMNKILAAHVRNDDEIAYKDEPATNGVKHEYKPVTPSPAKPPVPSSTAKSDRYLSQATIEDSDSEPEEESEDEDY